MADSLLVRRARERRLIPLLGLLAERGGDELAVIEGLVDGLVHGLDEHGSLDLDTDPRDWDHEIDQERRDEAVYRACKREADRRARVQRVANEPEPGETGGGRS